MSFVDSMAHVINCSIIDDNSVLTCILRAIPLERKEDLKDNLIIERNLIQEEIERREQELLPLKNKVIQFNEAIELLPDI
jgi:hypothetical protein